MKYLIIGAGGTGGVVGFHMAQAGKDVTLIARDAHLESIQQKGLTLQTMWDENTKTIPVKASDMQHYKDRPDVILVCVKGYSLDGIYEFIRRIAKPQTIVIPILNIYGTGAKMQEKLPGMLVTDGCIYVSANIKEPGVILQHGKILRIFFGVRQKEEKCQLLEQIQKDFRDSAIDGILSEQIQRDALEKFSYVSPIGAACCSISRRISSSLQELIFPLAARSTILSLISVTDIHSISVPYFLNNAARFSGSRDTTFSRVFLAFASKR